jgi:hypothetical protein
MPLYRLRPPRDFRAENGPFLAPVLLLLGLCMRYFNICKIRVKMLVVSGLLLTGSAALADEVLPVLKVGEDTYTNVLVTSVTPTDIYFTCGTFVGNAKLKKLDPALQKHFNYDAAKVAQLEQKRREANIPYSVLAARAEKQKIDSSNAQSVLDIAVGRVKEIVNQSVRSIPETSDMQNVGYYPDGWFHKGAIKPDFKNVDVRATQDFVYHNALVSSSLTPGVVFFGNELEFNGMTKYFYVDRSLPKKKLTQDEMLEINRMYRLIGKCQDVLGPKARL